MQIQTMVGDTVRATITAWPDRGKPYYLVVEMLYGKIERAWLHHRIDSSAHGTVDDISVLFSDDEAPILLERLRAAIDEEKKRIKRIGV